MGGATEVRNNNGTIRAFDVDYSRQLLYWIDNQNKVNRPISVVNVTPKCDLIFSGRELEFTIRYMLSAVRLSSVCRL